MFRESRRRGYSLWGLGCGTLWAGRSPLLSAERGAPGRGLIAFFSFFLSSLSAWRPRGRKDSGVGTAVRYLTRDQPVQARPSTRAALL